MIDSHAHLTLPQVFENIDAILTRAKQAGIQRIININTSLDELKKGLNLEKTSPWISNAAAITPHDAHIENESFFSYLEKSQLIAIGETGLDYHYYLETKERQKDVFCDHIDLAKKKKLPLIIHCRDAFDDLFSILKGVDIPVLLHCFTGTWEIAKKALDTGFMLSFSGIVTFSKSTELKEVAKKTPLDRFLIETDTPYLSPTPYRGKPCEPAYLIETLKHIASLKEIDVQQLTKNTTQNTLDFFSLTPYNNVL